MKETKIRLLIGKFSISEVLAIGYAVLLALIPWDSVMYYFNGIGFLDRANYKNYFLFGTPVFSIKNISGLLGFVSNEVIWHYGGFYLVRSLEVPIDLIFLGISFGFLLSSCLMIIRHSNFSTCLLLVNPLIIDLAFSQLRLALAITILEVAYLLVKKHKLLAIAFSVLALFIHTSSVVFIGIYIALKYINVISKYFSFDSRIRLISIVCVGVIISLVLGPFREMILLLLGDRRVDYPDMGSSFLYTCFWCLILLLLTFFSRALMDHCYYQYSIVILSIVTVNLLHGGYSTRFLAASFPFILCSLKTLKKPYRGIIIALLVLYSFFQWAFKLALF